MLILGSISIGALVAAIAAGVAAGVAAGLVVFFLIKLTLTTLRNKIKEKLAKRNLRKVAVGDLQKMVDNCKNQSSISELDTLIDQGYTHVIAGIDNNGKVTDIEIGKDELQGSDQQVADYINRSGEGMVVISA